MMNPNARSSPLMLMDRRGSFVAVTGTKGALKMVQDPSKAVGISFLCPKCTGEKEHYITCLFAGKLKDWTKTEGRYTALSDRIDQMSLLEIIRSNCGWRGCIREGEIRSTYE